MHGLKLNIIVHEYDMLIPSFLLSVIFRLSGTENSAGKI